MLPLCAPPPPPPPNQRKRKQKHLRSMTTPFTRLMVIFVSSSRVTMVGCQVNDRDRLLMGLAESDRGCWESYYNSIESLTFRGMSGLWLTKGHSTYVRCGSANTYKTVHRLMIKIRWLLLRTLRIIYDFTVK